MSKEISRKNAVNTMSSLEIANLTEKQHSKVMADIKRILEEVEINHAVFSEVYIAGNGQEQPCFNLPKRECDLIIAGYSAKYRLAIIDRWSELENDVLFIAGNQNKKSLQHIDPEEKALDVLVFSIISKSNTGGINRTLIYRRSNEFSKTEVNRSIKNLINSNEIVVGNHPNTSEVRYFVK
jgi:phage regulator Rha-like protein